MKDVPSVQQWFWVDYERSWWEALQCTVSGFESTAVQLTIGVLFGLAATRLSDILHRLTDWGRFLLRRRVDSREDHRPLLPSSQTQPKPPYPRNGNQQSRQATRGFISLVVAFAIWILVFVGWALAGGFATMVPPNNSGLSSSKVCGPYSLKADATTPERIADDMLQGQKEIRAGEYGRDCYGTRPVVGFDRCTFFNNQTIPYRVEIDQPCPFANASFCWGTYKAVRFTTDLVQASVIGLHSSKQPSFRRSTTCVPLNLDSGFMDGPYWNGDQLQVDYYLGPMNRSSEYTEYTFRQYGEPFKWGVSAYSVNVYQSTPYPEIDSWKPLSDLDREEGTYLSILFIASCRIKYTGPSNDYIFPATTLFKDGPYYYNDEPVSRPLACIDSSQVCSSDGNCSRIDQEHQDEDRGYEFVRAALRKSTTFQAIQSRLGKALVATDKIRDTISYELDDNQWRIESEALFRTSLSRIQYDALDIAIGYGNQFASYGNDSLDWVKQNTLCGLYKFNLPKGYTNINVLAFLGLVILIGFVAFLGKDTGVKFSDKKEEWFQGNILIFEFIPWAAWCCLIRDTHQLKSRWKARKEPRRPASLTSSISVQASGAQPPTPPPSASPPSTLINSQPSSQNPSDTLSQPVPSPSPSPQTQLPPSRPPNTPTQSTNAGNPNTQTGASTSTNSQDAQ